MQVRARRLEYAIRMTDITYFRLQRIKFFACTVWAFATRTVKNVNHVEVRFLTEIVDDFRRFVDEIWRF